MMLFLLPLAAALIPPAPPPSAAIFTTDDRAALEHALTAGVHARIAAGWKLVDVSYEGQSTAFVVLSRGTGTERHVVEVAYDGDFRGGSYRVETAAPAARDQYLPEFFDAVVASERGVLTLEPVCDFMAITGHIVERRATGAEAGRLAAQRLRAADDIESVATDGDEIRFALEVDSPEGARDRILALRVDADGQVVSAEVRRGSGLYDAGRYQRRRAMRRALAGRAVTGVEASGDAVTLLLGHHRFAIDPDGTAFVAHNPDSEETCGC